jgi:DNA-binding MarR family transcriptional regulator
MSQYVWQKWETDLSRKNPQEMRTAEVNPNERVKSARSPSMESSMGYLVRRTHRAFTRCLELKLAPHKISISMWFFLRLLWIADGQTQKELSDELGLTQATTVSAIDNLQKRGFVRRHRNRDDRRKSNIYLTDAGRALERSLVPYVTEVNAVALSKLNSAERRLLRELLSRINRSLNAETASRS